MGFSVISEKNHLNTKLARSVRARCTPRKHTLFESQLMFRLHTCPHNGYKHSLSVCDKMNEAPHNIHVNKIIINATKTITTISRKKKLLHSFIESDHQSNLQLRWHIFNVCFVFSIFGCILFCFSGHALHKWTKQNNCSFFGHALIDPTYNLRCNLHNCLYFPRVDLTILRVVLICNWLLWFLVNQLASLLFYFRWNIKTMTMKAESGCNLFDVM